MKLDYLFLRLIRHFLPEGIARFLLRQRWIIKPGLESTDPAAAVQRYISILNEHARAIKNQSVMVFGYGGRFAVGVELLNQGAAHVILCDHIRSLDNERNLELLENNGKYLIVENNFVKPRTEFITLLHGDIRKANIQGSVKPVDVVLSTSVFEHLGDVAGITKALAALTDIDGFHLHFIDLRDHYFKYPFEMLTFSRFVWNSFLNPTSNLNRLRIPDYQRHFETYFKEVNIKSLESDPSQLEKMRPRIRPEFISGDLDLDSTLQIQLTAQMPSRK
jgi:hypothetical protein